MDPIKTYLTPADAGRALRRPLSAPAVKAAWRSGRLIAAAIASNKMPLFEAEEVQRFDAERERRQAASAA